MPICPLRIAHVCIVGTTHPLPRLLLVIALEFWSAVMAMLLAFLVRAGAATCSEGMMELTPPSRALLYCGICEGVCQEISPSQ